MYNIFSLIKDNKLNIIFNLDLKDYIHKKNIIGQTPLIFACEEGNSIVVQLLLDNDADINCVDKFGNTALYYAETRNHLDIVLALKTHSSS
jgi:ankyrin repeat protein